jgi:hypothetical protein
MEMSVERIWKFPVRVTDLQTIGMPLGAKILSIDVQKEIVCIWALCDEKAEIAKRTIRIYGTGHAIYSDPGTFIGTFQMNGGNLVFHAFDIGEGLPNESGSRKRSAQS